MSRSVPASSVAVSTRWLRTVASTSPHEGQRGDNPAMRTGSASRIFASFVGIVPASRPRFVILVAVDEPRGAIWGGTVAAPAFQQIARFDLQYLEVPPDAAPGQ